MESFYAAVNSGADSVYLGGKLFNARQNSQNFDNEEMKHIIRYAHNKGVKVYVTLNIVLKDTEIADALNYAAFLHDNDADAVIVQDLGMLYLIKRFIPGLKVNMSTQTSVYDEFGVRFFDEFCVNKIIMARELSVENLRETIKNTDTDLEVFIHGALCTCYSGQCYMSSFLGGRSGNRGKCAQPCRLSYSFCDRQRKSEVGDFETMPVLSLKDFNAGSSIGELIDLGISTFKIEGRMKGPEYTSAVVEYYRQIIDNHQSGRKNDTRALEKRAISTFSRGYTNGYLKPSKDDEMFARTSSGIKGDIEDIQEETKDKTTEFSAFRRNKLRFEIALKIGEQAVLKATDGRNHVVVKSSEVCETSIKNPATEEIIKEQLGKLGNTIYELEDLKIIKDADVFLRKSTLNQLRREATEALYEAGAVVHQRKEIGAIPHSSVFAFSSPKQNPKPKLSLKINSDDDLSLIDSMKVKRVYVPFHLDVASLKNIEVDEKYLWIPNIVSVRDYKVLAENMKLYEEVFGGVCVNNAGSLQFFKERSSLRIHCGPFFNVINSFSAELLKEKGAEGFTFSIEANIRDMESITKNTSLGTEVVAHAYAQLMVMKNCPMSMLKNCKNLQDCEKCQYKDSISLKDRKGVYFNVERERRLTHIYNSVPLTILDRADDFIRAGIDYFMVDTKYLEEPEEIIDAMYCSINGVRTPAVLRENTFTRGHYLKNIL